MIRRKTLENVEKADVRLLNIINKPKKYGKRHIQVVLLFFCLALCFAYGSNLSVAMVTMVNNSSNPEFKNFDWNEETRGIIFSSQFWGFFFSSFFSGLIIHKFGGKQPLLVTLLAKTALILLTPILADLGWEYMIAKQILEGFIGGLVFPCVHTILSKWIHPVERGFLAPITLIGSSFGTIVMFTTSGLIASSPLGWPGTFYIPGIVGIIWCILWSIYGGDDPSNYIGISIEEQQFLESIPGKTDVSLSIPWTKIFGSKAVWALIISQCGESWMYVLLQRSIPTYIDGMYSIDIKPNAALSALPYLVSTVMILLSCNFSDFLINRKFISVKTSRKLFNTIGMWIPGITLIALGFITNNLAVAACLLTIILGFNATTHSGFVINHLDISPNFAGTIVGIYIAIGNIMSTMAPIFVGYVVSDTTDPALWREVFIVTAVICFISNFVFILMAETNVQEWNDVVEAHSRERSLSRSSDDGINFRAYMKSVKLS